MTGRLTAPYAAVLALLFVALSVRALLLRRRLGVGVGVGDGGDPRLAKALRAHGNFAEYAPLALFLIYLLETVAAARTLVHVYGVLLVVGRVVHAVGVGRVDEDYRFRVLGMACTFVVLVGASSRLLLALAGG